MIETKDFCTDGFVNRYLDFMPNALPIQVQYATDIFHLVIKDGDTSKVTVSAGRCGLGKSTMVQALISYFLLDHNYKYRGENAVGAVIVTDMLTRLGGYLGQPGKGSNGHERYCAYISSESSDETPIPKQLGMAKYKPIVLLSTQRYFSMTEDQLQELFTYRHRCRDGVKELRRSIVIFDEKPYFYTAKTIRVKNLNDCDTALRGIPKDCKDKDWIIQEYAQFRQRMTDLLRTQERVNAKSEMDCFYWHEENTQNITSNDEQFFKLIDKHKNAIVSHYDKAIQDLYVFKHLMVNGGLFIATRKKQDSGQDDDTYLRTIIDNRSRFFLSQEKVKFFVLDGTADIDPDYQTEYVRVLNSSQYSIPLDMSIEQSNVPASRSNLINGSSGEAIIKLVKNEITKLAANKNSGAALIITYKKIEEHFSASNVKTGHFGGVRGLNDYCDMHIVGQVGFNRQPELEYYVRYITRHPEELEHLRKMGEAGSRKHIKSMLAMKNGTFTNGEINQIMLASILSDFEQNIFRTSIRKYDNSDHVTVFTFWNSTAYAELNQMIAERYRPFGVEIIDLGVPDSVAHMRTEQRNTPNNEKTNPQKILNWIDMLPNGTEFKIENMLKEIHINTNQYKSAKSTNKFIRQLFQRMETEKKGCYRKC